MFFFFCHDRGGGGVGQCQKDGKKLKTNSRFGSVSPSVLVAVDLFASHSPKIMYCSSPSLQVVIAQHHEEQCCQLHVAVRCRTEGTGERALLLAACCCCWCCFIFPGVRDVKYRRRTARLDGVEEVELLLYSGIDLKAGDLALFPTARHPFFNRQSKPKLGGVNT